MKRTKERFRLPCVMNMLRKRAKNDFGFRGRLYAPLKKLYIPININTWLMFLHTKWGLVCNKMIKRGLIHRLPFKIFG